MSNQSPLHSSIVSMISLASAIASRHPDMGICQLERLRDIGIPEHQIDAVIQIARHIRDESSEKVDAAFDEKAQIRIAITEAEDTGHCRSPEPATKESCGCAPTPGGHSCC